MPKRTIKGLKNLIQQLEDHVAHRDKRKETVSKSDVAWQIDHSLKVINKVSETLINSDPESYNSKFNKWRFLLFNLNYIPRGRARAPKIVEPPELISNEALTSQIELAYRNVEKFELAHNNSHFRHMIFGVLNKRRTIEFLHLHTNHHLKIIRDIIK